MSYWISLRDKDGKIPEVDSFEEGGVYIVGGSSEADLNVTYNYAKHFDFRGLHEKKVSETISTLEKAIETLKDDTTDNYWDSTEGNTKQPLKTLLSWARKYPDMSWNVN